METSYLKNTINGRRYLHEEYVKRGFKRVAKEILEKDITTPITRYNPLHPENESTNFLINKMIEEASIDLFNLDIDTSNLGTSYHNLTELMKGRFHKISQDIEEEKERLEEMNVLLHRYNDFSAIEGIDWLKDAGGQFSVYQGHAALPEKESKNIAYAIEDISGNGYEGNEFVYTEEGTPVKEIFKTPRESIMDGSNATWFEYSRITVEKNEPISFFMANYDDIPTRMIMDLRSNEMVNQLNVEAEEGTLINSILVSENGDKYTETLKYPQIIKSNAFFSFMPAHHIRIMFESDKKTNEKIGFDYAGASPTEGVLTTKKITNSKTELGPDDFPDTWEQGSAVLAKKGSAIKRKIGEEEYEWTQEYEVIAAEPEEYTHFLETGKRSRIRVNSISTRQVNHVDQSVITVDKTKIDNTHRIALYSEEIIPHDFPSGDYIEYELVVNEKTFKVSPINTHKPGTKIIYSNKKEYQLLTTMESVGEVIKSVKLKIRMSGYNGRTPYIKKLIILTDPDESSVEVV